MAQVLLGDGLVPFVDSACRLRRPGRADLGLVGPTRSGLECLPLNPEAHDVEAEPLHFGGIRRIEVPWLAGIGVRDVGRVLVDDVDAVHENDASLGVVEIRPSRGAQVARDTRSDPLRLHAAAALVLHALALERHDVRRQRIDVGLVDDVLRRRRRGRRAGRRAPGRRRWSSSPVPSWSWSRASATVVVVVTGGFVVVVVVDGFGATVVVVVAAPAPAAPTTPSRGPQTMTATPVRAIDLRIGESEPHQFPLCIAKSRAELPTVPTRPQGIAHVDRPTQHVAPARHGPDTTPR